MNTTGQQIKAMREWLGLSPDAVGSYTKTSRAVVLAVESQNVDTPETIKIQKWLKNQIKRIKLSQAEKAAFYKHFEVGKIYCFSENEYKYARKNAQSKSDKTNYTFSGVGWGNDCIFKYIGKHGIHHCFKEIHGGWSRTYTDAQLVGKDIKEVD